MNHQKSRRFDFFAASKGLVSIFLALIVLTACGGGASTSSATTPSLTLSLINSSGAQVTNMVLGNTYTLKATVTQGGGALAPNVIVTFTSGSLASLSPSSGTALTDSGGVTSAMTITPTAAGASTMGGSATVQVTTITPATSTRAAVTTTTNVAVAGVLNYSVSAVAVTSNTGVLTFVSASPSQIFLIGSGASSQSNLTFTVLSSTNATLANVPVILTLTGNPGGVTFGSPAGTIPVTIFSDSSGSVVVPVFAGGTPGPVTIRAEWQSNSAVNINSSGLTIASGPPQQAHLSLAVSTHNIEGWSVDGSQTSLTATLADANGNPVPDGTVVNFVTDGGTINRSCATSTANTGGLNASGFSRCSVILLSANPRPQAGTSAAGVTSIYSTNGRVHVLAYVEGLKTYQDLAGGVPNQFDAGIDKVTDQGDAYRDDNENGTYETGEFVVSKGGALSCVNTGGVNPLLATNNTGTSGAPTPSRANTCTGSSTIATTARAQVAVAFSSNFPKVNSFASAGGGVGSFILTGLMQSADTTPTFSSLLPMPSGTLVTAASSVTTCTVTVTPSTVANTAIGTNPSLNYGTNHTFLATGTGCTGSTFKLTTTAPSGLAVTLVSVGTIF